jgi:chromosome partitioning protein
MEAPSYSPRKLAEMLGLSQSALQFTLNRGLYTAGNLWELRQKLGKLPCSLGRRKQLFLNFKGGTGKTSLSTSYAFRMAERGYRVLLIDLDPQAHATKCLGYEGETFPQTLFEVLVRRVPLFEIIQSTLVPNFDFVPSNLSMSAVDLSLMPMAAREFKLRNALREIDGRYDLTVFDAAPAFSLLNLNALMAADDLFVPVLADFLSFHGLKLLFETIHNLEEELGHVLAHVFIVINAFNATFKLAAEAMEALQKHYPEFLLRQIIRQCSKFAQASSQGVPVFVFDPECKAAVDIDGMIEEIVPRLGAKHPETLTQRAG